jgi:HK97 family phage major capsid protein
MNVLPKLTKSGVRQAAYLMRGQTEGVNAQGGVLVPEEVADFIVANRNLAGRFRQNVRVAPMATDVMTTPRRTTDVTVGFITEGQALSESTQAFDNIALVAKKLGALTRISSEIDEDQIEQETTDFARMLGYALALKEDQAGFNGDGTSTYGGIRGLTTLLTDSNHTAGRVSATSGHSTYGALTAADLGLLIGITPSWAMMGAKWYCSPYAYANCFARLGATAGSNVGPDGKPYLSYLGFEVVLTDQLPGNTTITGSAAILFGDLSRSATLGSRRAITIRRLSERFADADQIGFVVTQRFDIACHDLGDTNNPGGMVALLGG